MRNAAKVMLVPLLLLMLSLSAFADSVSLSTSGSGDTTYVDPSTLHFGSGYSAATATTTCSGSSTLAYQGCGGDPNKITSLSFDIYQNSGGSNPVSLSQNQSLLLIVSVPVTTTTSTEYDIKATSASLYSPPLSPTASIPLTSAQGAGSQYVQGSSSYSFYNTGFASGSVYDFLNLHTPTDKSNNWSNYSAADATLSIQPTSYDVYVLSLYSTASNVYLQSGGVIDVTLNGLPQGSFLAVYGQYINSSGNGKTVTIYDNPFTEAGMETGNTPRPPAVPEPATVITLLSGIGMLGGLVRRKA